MSIGIITIHNSTNYGACLQSWGLYKYLVDAGCEIIDRTDWSIRIMYIR